MSKKKPPVIIDVGTGYTKVGVSGEKEPRGVFPSTVGYPKHKATISSKKDYLRDYYVGEDAKNMRGVLRLRWPVKRGIVEDWEAWEKIIRYSYEHILHFDPSERPVLLSEAPFAPQKNTEKKAEIMFNTFNVPSLLIKSEALLSLKVTGKSTGLVIDSGEGVTQIVPVKNNYLLQHPMNRLNIAGQDVNRELGNLLTTKGLFMDTSAEKEIVRDIKHKFVYFALDYEKELKKAKQRPKSIEKEFVLPDGQAISLTDERFRPPEIHYQPSKISTERTSLSQSIIDTIMECELSLRPELYENLILSGGNSLITHFPQRLKKEVKKQAPQKAKKQIHVHPLPQRRYGVWKGGAKIADQPAYEEEYITLEQWKEEGTSILFKE